MAEEETGTVAAALATAADQEHSVIDASEPAEIPNDNVQLTENSDEVDMGINEDLPDAQNNAETEDNPEQVINLESTLSIQNVLKLYDKLKRSYATYDAIEIDASHVTSVDTAALQLFVALKKDAMKQKKDVVFFQPSPRFIESARLLDLLDILEITHI